MISDGKISRVATGQYTLDSKERFSYSLESKTSKKVFDVLTKKLHKSAKFIVYESSVLNLFLNHLIANSTLIVEVEKDLLEQVYWILKDDCPIGVITLRIALDGFWLHNAGHIGIAIDKPYRNQNYGTEAFKKICKIANNEYGIKDIIVMTLTDNIAGRTMIEKAGGKYWDTIIAADGEKLARYWIKSN